MKVDVYTYGLGENSVLIVNRAIVNGIREAGHLRHDHTPALMKHGIDWDGVADMVKKVEPGADVAVCQASISLEVLKRIREISPDTKIVIQRDSSHCVNWKRLVEAEQEKFGIHWDVYGGGLLEREKAEYELADRITVLSKWVQHTFEQQGLNDKVVHVGPQTFDHEKWPLRPMQRKWDDKTKFRVLFAGQTGLRKGLFYLLEAWKNLVLPNAELLIAGFPENPL
jgi:glycosyltransferase involved in cell wall biosynthesis